MIRAGVAGLLALAGAGPGAAPPPRALQGGQAVVHERVIIRVPVHVRSPVTIAWKEGKGPKCLPARAIAGASLAAGNSVDLMLRDGRRFRAKLESSCPALDYYYGFYITPNPDGLVCEDRDSIRSRVGGECEIDRFRSLEAVVRR
jgi:hypothetical protein